MGTEKDMRMELYESRLRLKREMQRALSCIRPSSKRKLAAEWREKYSEIFYQELLNCARKKEVAVYISEWDVEKMN